MSTFKCKMCGGTLDIQEGQTVAECEYCGTKQTVAKSRDEVISNLFSRANNLRMKSEFDRAEQTYEKILEQDNTEAEAHWGIVLCRYGIEYVEDPKTFKRIPTCHRTSYKAVTADADYLAALEHADLSQKAIYQTEARAIDEIQKNILAVVKNEKPFDVFICYKESDESGRRTHDSVIANDIYHQLTQEGFKVFYAAITLEDKLGQAYEPYIFAALNSAKVMLVLGTKPEYFSAVWVKNEWNRFLQLMKNDRSKLLIPCYRDMDAYDLPEEFAHLQAQDMGKIGFINDVVRGIKKVVRSEATAAPTVVKDTLDVFCDICHQKIPASSQSVFLCQVCGKHFCAAHMDVSGHICNACYTQQSNSQFDRYRAELEMQMYDDALSYFKSEMSKTTANPDVYYYAAIATMRGNNAFSQTRSTINVLESYIRQAILCEPKGIYYYFLAYIKYDYYERKYFRTKPNYKEAFSLAISNGITQEQVNEMYALMRVSRPSCL